MERKRSQQAVELLKNLDQIEVDIVLATVEGLIADKLRDATFDDRKPTARYFLAMDLVRKFGSVDMTVKQLIKLCSSIEKLILQSFPDARSRANTPLPNYPGLDIEGINIFHVTAIYTLNQPDTCNAIFNATKKAGLISKTHLRAGCGDLKTTPLHVAAEQGNKAFIDCILRTDPSQLTFPNSEGVMACEMAEAQGWSAIAALLRDKEHERLKKRALDSAADAVLKETVSREPQPPLSVPEDAMNRMVQMIVGHRSKIAQIQQAPPPVEDPRSIPGIPSASLDTSSGEQSSSGMEIDDDGTVEEEVGSERTGSAEQPSAQTVPSPEKATFSEIGSVFPAPIPKPNQSDEMEASTQKKTLEIPSSENSHQSMEVNHANPGKISPLLQPDMKSASQSTAHRMAPRPAPEDDVPGPFEQAPAKTVAATDRLDRLYQQHPGLRKTKSARPVSEEDAKALAMFVSHVCRSLPHGAVMETAYLEFLNKLAVGDLTRLKSSISNPIFASKFPFWMKRAVEAGIDDFIRENRRLPSGV
jgi:hypothetical protein